MTKRFLFFISLILTACAGVFFTHNGYAQSLISVTPNTTQAGQTFSPTVSATGTFFQSITPAGHIQNVFLEYGTNIIPYNQPTLNVTSHTQFLVSFTIPVSPVIGQYDLVVVYEDTTTFPFPTVVTLRLSQSVTIGTPNGFITGKVYEDVNGNGSFEQNEPLLQGQLITISPLNITIQTDVNGIYSFGVINNMYTIEWNANVADYFILSSADSTYAITISNNTSSANDFGVMRALKSIAPSTAWPGQTIQMLVSSYGLFQSGVNPNGNIYDAQLVNINAPVQIPVQLNATQILNSDSALLTFIIPGVVSAGNFDFFVQTGGPDSGFHYLRNSFTLLGPPSKIKGHVYYDANGNGSKDAGEPGIANRNIEIAPDNISLLTDANGNYTADLANSSYTVSWLPDILFSLTSSPAGYFVTLASNTSAGNDFGVTPVNAQYDGFVRCSGIARCNSVETFNCVFTNRSNIPAVSGALYMLTSSNMIYQSANPAPALISGDTLFWNFSNLDMFATYAVTVNYLIPFAGDTIIYKSYADILVGVNPVYSTTDSVSKIVSCTVSPNEKTANPFGENLQHLTLNNIPIDYTIHFRNTGTTNANTVTIYDRLDFDFDFSTFTITGSSHPVSTSLNPATGLLIFTFPGIGLPPSSVNPSASNAFVSYSIIPKTNLPEGTMVHNMADIFFDANVPVTTNQTWNTLVSLLFVSIQEPPEENEAVVIYPNPFDDYTFIKIPANEKSLFRLSVYSTSGKLVLQKAVSSNSTITKKELGTGFYFYEMVSAKSGKIYRGKITVQ